MRTRIRGLADPDLKDCVPTCINSPLKDYRCLYLYEHLMPTCLLSLVWNFALSWVVLFTLWRHPWSFTVTRMAKWNIFFQVIRYSKYSRTTCTVISMYTCATLPLLLKLCTILGSLVKLRFPPGVSIATSLGVKTPARWGATFLQRVWSNLWI